MQARVAQAGTPTVAEVARKAAVQFDAECSRVLFLNGTSLCKRPGSHGVHTLAADVWFSGNGFWWTARCKDVPQKRASVDSGFSVQQLIVDLVSHHVAVTSTLPVFDASVSRTAQIAAAGAECAVSGISTELSHCTGSYTLGLSHHCFFRKEMDFEVAFVKAGGLLLAGPDPTGNGGVLPGFGDQRGIELLVEAGFTPVQAIQIATENGAIYLGQQDRIGTLTPGKQADLVLIKGDLSRNIEEIENVETVFKVGIGYDSAKFIESVRGQVGIR